MECSICHEKENLTPFTTQVKGKDVKLNLCPKHLRLATFEVEVVLKEELEPVQKCCARPVNSNGRCTNCGDQY